MPEWNLLCRRKKLLHLIDFFTFSPDLKITGCPKMSIHPSEKLFLPDEGEQLCNDLPSHFMIFSRFDLGVWTHDETTICRFRDSLILKGLDKHIFEEIDNQLEATGLKVKNARGAEVGGMIIESSEWPGKFINIKNDR
jgi:hypothetical protein